MADTDRRLFLRFEANNKDLIRKLEQSQKAVSNFEQVSGKSIEAATKQYQRLGSRAAPAFNKFGKAANDNLAIVSRRAGQASIQLQQFVGQVQGGTNVMVAASQQFADLGIVLGAPLLGALGGIVAALSINLIPNLFESEEAAKFLEGTLDDLSKVAVETDGNVLKLSEEIEKLASQSLAAAQGLIAVQIQKTRGELDKLGGVVEELNDGLVDGYINLTTFLNAARPGQISLGQEGLSDAERQLVSFQNELGLSVEESEKLADILNSYSGESVESVQDLTDKFSALFVEIKKPSKNLIEFAEELITVTSRAATAQEKLVFLEESLKDLNGTIEAGNDLNALENTQKSIDRIIEKLEVQASAAKDSANSTDFYRAKQLGATAAELERIQSLQGVIDKQKELENIQKMEDKLRETSQSDFSSLQNRLLGDEDALRSSYENDLNTIKEYEQLFTEEKEAAEEARKALTEKFNQDAEILAASNAQKVAQAYSSAFSATFSGAEQFAQGMMQLSEEGSTAYKAFYLISQGIAAAQAIIQGFSAAAATNLAYAQLAAITANPGFIAAGQVAAQAQIAFGFATAGLIAGQTLASFEGGGLTPRGPRSGGMDGKGGMLAMLHPNEKVIDMNRGNGDGYKIEVHNYGGSQINTSVDDEKRIISIVVDQMRNSSSPSRKALQETSTLQPRGFRR